MAASLPHHGFLLSALRTPWAKPALVSLIKLAVLFVVEAVLAFELCFCSQDVFQQVFLFCRKTLEVEHLVHDNTEVEQTIRSHQQKWKSEDEGFAEQVGAKEGDPTHSRCRDA